MFAQIAQRLMPLRVQSNKMATTTAVAMTFCQSSRRMGASAMTSTSSSSSSPSSPPGSGTWRMGGSNILLSGGRISLLPSGRPYPSTPGAAYYYSVVPNYSSPGASSSTSCSTTTMPILASSYSSALPRLLLANAVGGNAPALHTRGFATKKVRVVGGGGVMTSVVEMGSRFFFLAAITHTTLEDVGAPVIFSFAKRCRGSSRCVLRRNICRSSSHHFQIDHN